MNEHQTKINMHTNIEKPEIMIIGSEENRVYIKGKF